MKGERLEVKGNDGFACWLEGGGWRGRLQAAMETGKLSWKFSSLKDSSWKVLELFPKEARPVSRFMCLS